ncbi:MAG: hypothetical protein WCH31_08410 [Actinomycetes bacterium]
MQRRLQLVLTLTVAAAALLAATAQAAPQPDSHDRALIVALGKKLETFESVSSSTSGDAKLKAQLDSCKAITKDPSTMFAAIVVLIPALLIDVVNQAKPQLVGLHSLLTGMDAHEPLFAQWLAAEAQEMELILRFDNHGKTIDYCKAAAVLLDKKSTPAELRAALGVDPSVVASLFASNSSALSAKLKRLNPQMRKFFIAAGLTSKAAAALTR